MRIHRRSTYGFTLVELIGSVAVMSVLMVALGSALVLASRAAPDGNEPFDTMLEAGTIAGDITADLRYAQAFAETSPSAVEFTVPDRNHGATGPEVIRYEWSGTPGDPLIRTYNRGEGVTIADDVHEFQLTYDLAAVESEETPENESEETILVEHTTAVDIKDYAVHSNHWIGAYIRPTLPPDAVGWKVTEVRFRARVRDAPLGLTMVQLRPATSDHRPEVTVLEQVSMYESALAASYLWWPFSFSRVSGIHPSQGLCLVLKHVEDDDSCEIEYQDTDVLNAETHRVDTGNGGDSWGIDTDKAMSLYVKGTVTTAGEPVIVTTDYLSVVGLSLRVGEHAESRVDTAVQILNRPEVAGP